MFTNPHWNGRRRYWEKPNWGRVPEGEIAIGLLHKKNEHGWNSYYHLMFRRLGEDQIFTYPVLSQSYLTTAGSLQTTNCGLDNTWNNASNRIEIWGAGGSGGSANGNGTAPDYDPTGGGAGEYSYAANYTLSGTPGTTTYSWEIGLGGAAVLSSGGSSHVGNKGGDSWWNGSTQATASIGAIGGSGGTLSTATPPPLNSTTLGGAGGTGGSGASPIVHVPGGRGGNIVVGATAYSGTTGGGAPAGPNGAAANGGDSSASQHATDGGRGDGGLGGAGGLNGTGGTQHSTQDGSNGTEFTDGVHGLGGGGGGVDGTVHQTTIWGGDGGLYAAGSGGCRNTWGNTAGATSGAGTQGIIVFTWNPVTTTAWSGSATLTPVTSLGADLQKILGPAGFVPTTTLHADLQKLIGSVGLAPVTSFGADLRKLLGPAGLAPTTVFGADAQKLLSSGQTFAPTTAFGAVAGLAYPAAGGFVSTTNFGADAQKLIGNTSLGSIDTSFSADILLEKFLSVAPWNVATSFGSDLIQFLAAPASLAPAANFGANAQKLIGPTSIGSIATTFSADSFIAIFDTAESLFADTTFGADLQKLLGPTGLAPVATFGADIAVFNFDTAEHLAATTLLGADLQKLLGPAGLNPTTTFGAIDLQKLLGPATLQSEATLGADIQGFIFDTEVLAVQASITVSETQLLAIAANLAGDTFFGGDLRNPNDHGIKTSLRALAAIVSPLSPPPLAPEAIFGADIQTYIFDYDVEALAAAIGLADASLNQLQTFEATLAPSAGLIASPTMTLVGEAGLAAATALKANAQTYIFDYAETLAADSVFASDSTAYMAALASPSAEALFDATANISAPLHPLPLIPEALLADTPFVQYGAIYSTLAPTADLISSETLTLTGAAELAAAAALQANAQTYIFDYDAEALAAESSLASAETLTLAALSSPTVEALLAGSAIIQMPVAASLAPSATLSADAFQQAFFFNIDAGLASFANLGASVAVWQATNAALSPSALLGATPSIAVGARAALTSQATLVPTPSNIRLRDDAALASQATLVPAPSSIMQRAAFAAAAEAILASSALNAMKLAQSTLASSSTLAVDLMAQSPGLANLKPEALLSSKPVQQMAALSSAHVAATLATAEQSRLVVYPTTLSTDVGLTPPTASLLKPLLSSLASNSSLAALETQQLAIPASLIGETQIASNFNVMMADASAALAEAILLPSENLLMQAAAPLTSEATFGAFGNLIPSFFNELNSFTSLTAVAHIRVVARAGMTLSASFGGHLAMRHVMPTTTWRAHCSFGAIANQNVATHSRLPVASKLAGNGTQIMDVAGLRLASNINLHGMLRQLEHTSISIHSECFLGANLTLLRPDIISVVVPGQPPGPDIHGHGDQPTIGGGPPGPDIRGHPPGPSITGQPPSPRIRGRGPQGSEET